MYSNTGYLNHSDIEIEDNIHPLIIGSCGIYRMLTVPALRTTCLLYTSDAADD